jgi:dTDP-4-amino-4,6-dideoxygalactose transaminase
VSGGIPLVDLAAQDAEVRAEVEAGWRSVLDRTAFVLGDEVGRFESAFAKFSGVAHCIGVANGTDALELALRAVGIGAGDEVLVPANTFIASALAVARIGAAPVFVDVDPATQLFDADDAAARVTARTKAVLPVHLFGQMAPMTDVERLAAEHGLLVVEDAAQSQGAAQRAPGFWARSAQHDAVSAPKTERRGSGSIGIAAGTSFYPGKNLGAYGDAGAVLTDDDSVAGRVRALRNYGSEVKYHHPMVGFNSRLDTLQAVVLSAKLKRLAAWNEARRAAARRYDALLADLGIGLPATLDENEHVWHLYVVRVPERDRVLAALNAAGVGAGVHYPVPIHLQGAFASLGHREGDFPVAEAAAREILSLPIYPHITESQQEQVADALRKAVR